MSKPTDKRNGWPLNCFGDRKSVELAGYRTVLLLPLFLFVLGMSACNSPRFPLRITEASVSPSPIIGEVATLRIEVMSSESERDATIKVYLPAGIKLVSGETTWQGSLDANMPKTHALEICVLYQGEWRIDVDTRSYKTEDSSYGDEEILHIWSTSDAARVVPSSRYRYTQPPGGIVMATPTPLPPLTTPVCP